ncbi:unnamed protein product [Spirodela intermedia]|uniref:Uncharacterized protein n=2 Tax=Spirodela intermedia TaxID=51605 RepID=A0A7I8JRL4_SPIIN|nr:unnamed protein product [Spirodela intermedia]CAA6672808.1 unnamed protein product [Spirodela intermedia]CAA7410027.1 unnamed protein product [Spirodela intermedia]
MAKKPGKGNADQGKRGRQGSVNASCESARTWTNPVARMTPAANAFETTKRPDSARRNRQLVPTRGSVTPATLETRITAMAIIFNLSAASSSLHSAASPPPEEHSAFPRDLATW